MKNKRLFDQIFWMEKFIKDNTAKINEKLESRKENAHLLSLKLSNMKTIENFKTATIAYIEELENELEKLQNPHNLKTGATTLNTPNWHFLTEREKEQVRTISISNLQVSNPELF